MRFLLVDDDKSALMSLKYRLMRHRIQAETFDEAHAALEAFAVDPERFCAVVAKLAMRRLRGDAFARRVWAIQPEIPIAILSGLPQEECLEEARVDQGVWTLSNPAAVSDILVALESQGLMIPFESYRERARALPGDAPESAAKAAEIVAADVARAEHET